MRFVPQHTRACLRHADETVRGHRRLLLLDHGFVVPKGQGVLQASSRSVSEAKEEAFQRHLTEACPEEPRYLYPRKWISDLLSMVCFQELRI